MKHEPKRKDKDQYIFWLIENYMSTTYFDIGFIRMKDSFFRKLLKLKKRTWISSGDICNYKTVDTINKIISVIKSNFPYAIVKTKILDEIVHNPIEYDGNYGTTLEYPAITTRVKIKIKFKNDADEAMFILNSNKFNKEISNISKDVTLAL